MPKLLHFSLDPNFPEIFEFVSIYSVHKKIILNTFGIKANRKT